MGKPKFMFDVRIIGLKYNLRNSLNEIYTVSLKIFTCRPISSGRITRGPGGGLAPLVVLMAPLVQLMFRGSGGRKTALLEPQNGPP